MKRVYVFDMDNDLVKIGISVDVEKRMSGVSHASGFAILRHCKSALMSDDESRAIERELHAHFAAYRTNGEFFKLSFEEACDELNKRTRSDKLKTAVPVNLEKRELTPKERIVDFMRLFVKKFCTLDRNRGGVSGGGIFRTNFLEEFIEWFNAHSQIIACDKEYLGGSLEEAMRRREHYDVCHWVDVRFYFRRTGEEIRDIDILDVLREAAGDRDIISPKICAERIKSIRRDSYDSPKEEFYSRIYWRQGTPQELVLQQRVQRVRDAFTGLDQRAKDSIIGGFVNNFIKHIDLSKLSRRDNNNLSGLFQPDGTSFGNFADSVIRYIENQLCELCGEHFRVHIETNSDPFAILWEKDYAGYYTPRLLPYSHHRGIIAHPFTYDLDDEKIGIYYGSFTQIIQDYCPLEVFFSKWGLHVRYVGGQACK